MDTALLVSKSPAEERLVDLLAPSVEGMGYELVRLRMIGTPGGAGEVTLQIMAERPDGTMEIDDCATLSEAVSAILDVEDPIDREYSLEVSSPGIDRPLTRSKDFATYAGHRAKIDMAMPVDTTTGPRRKFRGDLQGLDGDAISLKLDDLGLIALPLRDVADAKLLITDALIAESLKKKRVPDASAADDVEYETDTESAERED